jgi:predicted dehydrogenase
MGEEIRVALLGLDTSHTVTFSRMMHDPACPVEQKVEGMKVSACLRFLTPFTTAEILDERQRQLEAWGIRVTESLEEAVEGCDAIILTINDGAYHLDYFLRCSDLGKPIFLDKPMADDLKNARRISEAAQEKGVRFFTSSSLRFAPELLEACRRIPEPTAAHMYGPVNTAKAGSSIVWYGVHAFEMLETAMGRGARSVRTFPDVHGFVNLVEYADGRRGIVELISGGSNYGGCLQTHEQARHFAVDPSLVSTLVLRQAAAFFQGAEPPVSTEDSLEVMAMLDAAERSFQNRSKPAKI